MSCKVNGNNLLKKYAKIWKKVSSLMHIVFDSEPVYGDNDKYIKTKIKTFFKGRVSIILWFKLIS